MARGLGAGTPPATTLELCPLSDGGPGFVDVLAAALPAAGWSW